MISLCVLPGSVCSSRTLILFTFGCTLAVVLMTFQYEHKLLLFNSPRLMLTLPSLSLISICGLGAGCRTRLFFQWSNSNQNSFSFSCGGIRLS